MVGIGLSLAYISTKNDDKFIIFLELCTYSFRTLYTYLADKFTTKFDMKVISKQQFLG